MPNPIQRKPTVVPLSQEPRPRHALARNLSVGSLLVALVVGMQLGSIPWRYRREIWQFQGFAVGALVGYLAGRLGVSRQISPRLPGSRD
jgi:hypothetical protein